MALNELYEGLEIIHLEDFSNEVNINADLSTSSFSGGATRAPRQLMVSTANQAQKTVLSDVAQICYGGSGGSSRSTSYTSTFTATELTSLPRLVSGNGTLVVKANKGSGGRVTNYSFPLQSIPFIGLLFTYPSTYTGKRVMLSFDYIPVEGSTSISYLETKIVIRPDNGNYASNDFAELVPFVNNHLTGKLEFIFEPGTISVFFRNKLIATKPHNLRTVFIGEVLRTTDVPSVAREFAFNTFPSARNPFNIANLVMVAVPLDSPIKRLGNVRIQRSLVNELDGSPHTESDSLNGSNTNDGKSLEVDHNVNTIGFAPIKLNDGEAVMGTQMCISGINTPTGSNIETVVSNGEEELTDVTHTLIETHLSREVVGDFILGDVPEDYTNVTLKVRSVEV